jgi:hypothetical protein
MVSASDTLNGSPGSSGSLAPTSICSTNAGTGSGSAIDARAKAERAPLARGAPAAKRDGAIGTDAEAKAPAPPEAVADLPADFTPGSFKLEGGRLVPLTREDWDAVAAAEVAAKQAAEAAAKVSIIANLKTVAAPENPNISDRIAVAANDALVEFFVARLNEVRKPAGLPDITVKEVMEDYGKRFSDKLDAL